MNVTPVTLTGVHVRLEPPADAHAADLANAGQAAAIWDYMPFGPFATVEEWKHWLASLREKAERAESIPFVIVRRADARAIGMTSYLNIQPRDRGLEIGGTWLTPDVWRTVINSESKYLLLRHAFETLGCVRVQLKTDARNVRSQRAIERLGAAKEGVLRKHMMTRGGFIRDTVMYSIVDTEWPAVKARLENAIYPVEERR